tara:strand:- start:421 stop:975 length:555 start_codon:yes stop_codon:yes gene_type:complete
MYLNILPKFGKKVMFPKVFKLIVSLALFIYGSYQIYDSYTGNGIFMILISAFFILIYFKNEIIFLAFLRLRKQDIAGTQKWLSYIKNPKSCLVKKQQGYFNYLHGIINSQINLTVAEKYFKKALELGLSMSHDIAMAKLSLAGILMQKRRKREATDLLNQAKRIDKHGMLSTQIKMMREQMKKI